MAEKEIEGGAAVQEARGEASVVPKCEEKKADGEPAGGRKEKERRECSQLKPDLVIKPLKSSSNFNVFFICFQNSRT